MKHDCFRYLIQVNSETHPYECLVCERTITQSEFDEA